MKFGCYIGSPPAHYTPYTLHTCTLNKDGQLIRLLFLPADIVRQYYCKTFVVSGGIFSIDTFLAAHITYNILTLPCYLFVLLLMHRPFTTIAANQVNCFGPASLLNGNVCYLTPRVMAQAVGTECLMYWLWLLSACFFCHALGSAFLTSVNFYSLSFPLLALSAFCSIHYFGIRRYILLGRSGVICEYPT